MERDDCAQEHMSPSQRSARAKLIALPVSIESPNRPGEGFREISMNEPNLIEECVAEKTGRETFCLPPRLRNQPALF